MKWQPIKNAPMDGSIIIAKGYHDYGKRTVMMPCSVVYRNEVWWRDNSGYGFVVQCYPSNWIPMPEEI